ncbi:uncharacterized protein si:dkey-29h14.10 [Nematolebias whitei]|uniref:uncharacterized protein si:dkey-29h14.10 n=1 Tax=Nematolebias whitei TaxID=451745 RepID=UPI001899B84B|nr:uncharacterized protein si:dkey-29h14.10 [Nematolebias whitei]
MNETASSGQVMTFKASRAQRFIQLVQTAAHTSCKFFCMPFSEKAACCPDKTLQPEEKNTNEPLQHSPSAVLIVNISNSTLIDCVIGDSYPCAVADRHPLMRESQLLKSARVRCSCCHKRQEATPPSPPVSPGEHQNISIHSSSLNCVIIGDNNHMRTELSEPFV